MSWSWSSSSSSWLLLIASLLCQVHSERRLVVDVDAGADDALGLLLTLLEPGVKVLAVTCVRGNADLDNVVVNVLKTLHAANRLDVPVFAGASSGLLRSEPLDYYFGRDGFGDFDDPELSLKGNGSSSSNVREEAAAVALVRLAKEEAGRLELLCLGPLTNVALATRLDKAFLPRLRRIAVMGSSAIGLGNVAPGVEFNFRMDPEAASVVLDNTPLPVLLVPWDTVTRTNISMDWRVSVLGSTPGPLMSLLNKAERRLIASQSTWRNADGVAAAVFLQPSLVTQRGLYHADVETQGRYARGALMVDYTNRLRGPPNVDLVEAVDAAAFQKLVLARLTPNNSDHTQQFSHSHQPSFYPTS